MEEPVLPTPSDAGPSDADVGEARAGVSWIFQASPDQYDLGRALASLDEMTWTMNQHRDRVQPGDRVYMWELGADAGIVAIGSVLTRAEWRSESAEELAFWRDPSGADTMRPRVRVAVDRRLDPRLPRSVLREHPVLADLPNLRMAQATNYPLSDEQASALQELIADWSESTRPAGGQVVPTPALPRIVKIAPGPEGRYWKECLAGGYICVGWPKVGDIRRFSDFASFRDEFRRHYDYNGHEPTVTKKAREVWTLRELKPGDVVIANGGTEKVLGVGRVVEPRYEFRDGLEYPHIVHVAWDESKARTIPMMKAWFGWTVADIPPDQLVFILPDVAAELGIEAGPVVKMPETPDAGSAWMVLQTGNPDTRDIEGRAYAYGLGLANGRRIAVGDLLVVTRTAKTAVEGGRVIGVGHVDRIDLDGDEATAWYGWYAALTPPVAFEEVGGDPRSNTTNSINRIDREWVVRALAARGLTIEGIPPIDPGQPLPDTHVRKPEIARRDPKLTIEWLENETLWPRQDLERIVEVLTGKSPQAVLAGPPGTGKTWVAQRIARYVTGGVPGAMRTVQFHPSYAYEQFIEGLRPVVERGGIAFRRVDGVVLEMVAGMHGSDDRRVLVIDEMNRANLPRVFGELMYLFEYREDPIALQYSPSFALPPGLSFLGTMNTADRSIRSLDIALRRRFDVFECPPSSAILKRWFDDPEHSSEVTDLIGGFERLNVALEEALDRHHTIGHTFFLTERMTADRLRHVWRHKLGPIIEEYFFDQPDIAGRFSVGEFWPDASDAH